MDERSAVVKICDIDFWVYVMPISRRIFLQGVEEMRKKATLSLAVLVILCMALSMLAACDSSGSGSVNPVIRLSTTTSVNDSGLLSYLQPEFESDTEFRLEITSAGSGAAIEKGRTGDADCLLVHSPAAERDFIGEGYGEERVSFMHNFFVIVGPDDDPAGVRNSSGASDAFKKIAENPDATFVSRGDESGTHAAEMRIWGITEMDPEGEPWYMSTGQGMGASLTIANETGAYILTDKSTYLAHESSGSLVILLEKSDEMKNTYSIIAISPERWDNTNIDGSNAFIAWMTSGKGLGLINQYGVEEYGQQLFFSGE